MRCGGAFQTRKCRRRCSCAPRFRNLARSTSPRHSRTARRVGERLTGHPDVAVFIEGDCPIDYVDRSVFVAPVPSKGHSLLRRVVRAPLQPKRSDRSDYCSADPGQRVTRPSNAILVVPIPQRPGSDGAMLGRGGCRACGSGVGSNTCSACCPSRVAANLLHGSVNRNLGPTKRLIDVFAGGWWCAVFGVVVFVLVGLRQNG